MTGTMKPPETRSPDTDAEPDLAEQIQEALAEGASVERVCAYFHLSRSEIEDFCPELIEDDFDDPSRNDVTGY